MQAASRESLADARDRLNALVERTDADGLRELSDELFSVVGVLAAERSLRRLLADTSTAEDDRARLADAVFGGRVAQSTMDIITGLARSRWSHPGDLVDATESLARQAVLIVAEQDGSIEDVEDELFRFARILDSSDRLLELLGDESQPAERRLSLLDELISGKVRPITRTLLRHAVLVPRGRSLDTVVEALAELAAARRDRSVAHVTSATPLSGEQERRLAEALSAIYRKPVSVQVELDPELLGGLVIRLGNEVIDGSVVTKLVKARRELSG